MTESDDGSPLSEELSDDEIMEMMDAVPKGEKVFDCGCKTVRKGENFVIHPCGPDCMVLMMLMELSAQDGKNIKHSFTEEVEDVLS